MKIAYSIITVLLFFVLCAGLPPASTAQEKTEAQERVVHVYSSRKERPFKDLFTKFEKSTGIKVRFVINEATELIEQIENEGERSPADLFLTNDITNLGRAKEKGLLASISSDILNANIPPGYRDEDGRWYGLTLRSRAIVYSRRRVDLSMLSDYEDLASPFWHGSILARSSRNDYTRSLIASMIAAEGVEKTEKWAKRLVRNFVRKPKGGDTDQIKAIAAGKGDVAIVNSYYLGRLQASRKEGERKLAAKVGIFFPNQEGRGAHVNISGGGVVKTASNKAGAQELLEFLSSPEAQKIYAEVNHEFPVSPEVETSEIVKSWGEFKRDTRHLSEIYKHIPAAIKLLKQAGWK